MATDTESENQTIARKKNVAALEKMKNQFSIKIIAGIEKNKVSFFLIYLKIVTF